MRARGPLTALALTLVPAAALALGTLEVGVTAGPDSFAERSAFLRLDPWELLAVEAEAAFSDDEGSSLTEFYRFGATLRTPAGLDLGGGLTRSPAADGVRSDSAYGEVTLTFAPVPGRWDFATALCVAYEDQTYSFRVLDRWVDVGQERWSGRLAQTLFERWVFTAELTTYSYDRDLDRAARALALLGLLRPNQNLLFTADRVSSLPDRTWGLGLDLYPAEGWRLGASYSRIEAAVDAFGVDQDRWGAAVGRDFPGGVGVTAGADLYVGGGEESLYPYLRLSWDF